MKRSLRVKRARRARRDARKKRLARYIARKARLGKRSDEATDVEELKDINAELEELNEKIEDLQEDIAVDEEEEREEEEEEERDDDEDLDEEERDDDEDLDEEERDDDDELDEEELERSRGRGRSKRNSRNSRSGSPVRRSRLIASYGMGSGGASQRNSSFAKGTNFEGMEREELFSTSTYRSAYLKSLQGKDLSKIEKRAITTAVNSGGAAVPTATYEMIIEKLEQTSVLFPLISATYIPGNVTLPVANAKTAAEWSDEAVEGVEGDDTLNGVSLGGYTLAKYSKISAAASAMAISAFETYLVNQIGDQLAIAIENAILNGKGPTPSGGAKAQPTGILTGLKWDAKNSKTFTNAIGYDDLVDLRALIKSPYRPNACFILNSNTEAQLFKVKTTTEQPIFSQSPQNGFEQKILNIPYIVDDYMPDDTIILGVLSYYYMNFSQNPMIESSKEAGFTSATTIYRGILVADGKPALAEAFVKLTKAK